MNKIIAKILYLLGFKPEYSTGVCGETTRGYGLTDNGYFKYQLDKQEVENDKRATN